jgi:hypothetical protein
MCTLHDIGQQYGIDFLVMESLDGETLAARRASFRARKSSRQNRVIVPPPSAYCGRSGSCGFTARSQYSITSVNVQSMPCPNAFQLGHSVFGE